MSVVRSLVRYVYVVLSFCIPLVISVFLSCVISLARSFCLYWFIYVLGSCVCRSLRMSLFLYVVISVARHVFVR